MKIFFLAILLALAVAVPLEIWREGKAQAQKATATLQCDAAALPVLESENIQFSNNALIPSTNALTEDQFRELLRLRGQMTSLRNGSDEVEKLKSRIAQLQAVLTNPPAAPPDPQKILAHWPKTQLAPAGYGDPLSALQTALSAVNQNDPKALLDSVTPEAKSELTRAQWNNRGPEDVEMAKATQRFADSLGPVDGFDVVGQESPAPDKATVEVYFEGEARNRQFLLEQVGGVWKLAGFGGGWGVYFP